MVREYALQQPIYSYHVGCYKFSEFEAIKAPTQGLLDISVCLIRHFDFFNFSSVKKSVDCDSGISEKSYWAPWEIYMHFDQN